MYFGYARFSDFEFFLYSGFLDHGSLFLFYLFMYLAETPYCLLHDYTNLDFLSHILVNTNLSSSIVILTDVRPQVTVTSFAFV